MSRSCPVCYETFVLESNDIHAPCKLIKCNDIICLNCIETEIFDQQYYCPECGLEYNGNAAADFTKRLTSFDENASTNESSADTSSTPVPIDQAINYGSRRMSVRMPCQEPGCRNKALGLGFCFEHSTSQKQAAKISSVLEDYNLAKKIEAKDLSDISMTTSGVFETRNKKTSIDPDDIINRFKLQQRLELGEAMEILNLSKNLAMYV